MDELDDTGTGSVLPDGMVQAQTTSDVSGDDILQALLSQCQAHEQFRTFVTYHMSKNVLSPDDWEFGRNRPYEDVVAFHHWCISSGEPSVVDLDLLRQVGTEVEQMVDESTRKSHATTDDTAHEEQHNIEHQTKQEDAIDGAAPPPANTQQHTSQPAATILQQQEATYITTTSVTAQKTISTPEQDAAEEKAKTSEENPVLAPEDDAGKNAKTVVDPAEKTISTPEEDDAENAKTSEENPVLAPEDDAGKNAKTVVDPAEKTISTPEEDAAAENAKTSEEDQLLAPEDDAGKNVKTVVDPAEKTIITPEEDAAAENAKTSEEDQLPAPEDDAGKNDKNAKTEDTADENAKMTTTEDAYTKKGTTAETLQESTDVQTQQETPLTPELCDSEVVVPVSLKDTIRACRNQALFAEFIAMDNCGIDDWGKDDPISDLKRYNEFLESKGSHPWDINYILSQGQAQEPQESQESEIQDEENLPEAEESDESEGESRIDFQYPLAPTADHPQIKCVLRSAAKVRF